MPLVELLFCQMAVFGEIVLFLALGNFTVFNGLHRTVADAGHAVGAVVSPDGAFVFERNIVERAEPLTFTTAYALVGGVKVLGTELVFYPHRVKGDGDQSLPKLHFSCTQLLTGGDKLCNPIESAAGFMYALFDLFQSMLGVGVTGDVVSGHAELSVPAVIHPFLFDKLLCKDTGDAAVAAAGEDEIYVPAAEEVLLLDI